MLEAAVRTVSRTAVHRRHARQQLRLHHILVPLDFSGESRQALESAVPLARAQAARISLIHVVQSPAIAGPLPDGNHFVPLNIVSSTRQAEARLGDMALELLPEDVRGKTLVCEGEPVTEILTAAERHQVDLIALSTHGYTGFSRVLLGSTARSVVRQAPCSVLTIRRQPGRSALRVLAQAKPVYPDRPTWRRILVPLDFSLTSLHALNIAVPLARASGAHCDLLHVVEPKVPHAGMDGAILAAPLPVSASDVQRQLFRVCERFVPAALDTTLLVAEGRAAATIVERAQARAADVIVLSTHGRKGLNRLLLGSTAEQVVCHATCPVLVVRHARRLCAARNPLPS
jgi:nucleotide-binding universal stress UspA family protein